MNQKVLVSLLKKYNFLVGLFVTTLLIAFSFLLSLKLSLYGDDWLRLHILKFNFDTGIGESYFSIKSYIGPYNPQYIFLFFVRLFWGYNPVGYFLTSLILRLIGSASFYFPLKKITKSSLIGWVGAILIGTTPIGIQVTDWVFYMNTYASLIPLSWTLYLGILLHKKFTFKKVFLFVFSSALFIFLIPVRSYGFFLAILVFSIAEIFLQKKMKLPILQTIFLICVYGFAKIIGDLGPTTDVLSSIQSGVKNSYGLLLHHSYYFLIVPFVDFGRILFPDMFFQRLQDISKAIISPQIFAIFLLLLIVGCGYYLWKNVSGKELFLWLLINCLIFVITQFILVNPSFTDRLYASLGFWFLFNTIYYLLSIHKKKTLVMYLLCLFCFIFPYYLLPWSFDPSIVLTSDHRYLYFPAVGLLVACTFILNHFNASKRHRKYIILFILLVTSINIVSDTIYFKNQLRFRSEARQETIFASIHKLIPNLPKNHQSIFYITDTTGKKMDVYSFGFPFYMGISYEISQQGNLPFMLLNLDEVHSAITDGKVLMRYSRTIKKVHVDDIYFLKLLPNDIFVLNKNEVLEELKIYDK